MQVTICETNWSLKLEQVWRCKKTNCRILEVRFGSKDTKSFIETAEQMANVERETRILSVHRAVDRTPYWKSESVNQAIESTLRYITSHHFTAQ